MAKQVYECNWAPSRVTEEQLNNLVKTGALAKKDVIHWRVPGTETPPEPKDGEVVVFTDHMLRGFCPPSLKFFRDVLHFSTYILKILDQIMCPTYAISKYSARFICKKNQLLTSF